MLSKAIHSASARQAGPGAQPLDVFMVSQASLSRSMPWLPPNVWPLMQRGRPAASGGGNFRAKTAA